MIQRTGGAGREHFHAGDIARDPHRLVRHVVRERQQETADPVFQQESVGQAFEQRVPVMLVHVDQTGQDDAAAGVNHLIEAAPRRCLVCRPGGVDVLAIGGDIAARKYIALRIDRDHVSVFYEDARHYRLEIILKNVLGYSRWNRTAAYSIPRSTKIFLEPAVPKYFNNAAAPSRLAGAREAIAT